MQDQLEKLRDRTIKVIAELVDETALAEAKTRVLGRKGELTRILRGLKDLPNTVRSQTGLVANRVKAELEERFDLAEAILKEKAEQSKLESEFLDVTVPGRRTVIPGGRHVLNSVTEELTDVFRGLGFQLAEGPEVELEYYNFEALNIPRDHPARDMQDTFYFSKSVVLRTHTSPVQIRTMEKHKPPVRVICPGKVYRRDPADISHFPMFMQIEGLWVERSISFSDLKGVLTAFVHEFFGSRVALRFRPSFFPFTEPSVEVDIRCVICGGDGCRTCSNGWIEILGAGMVDPEVFRFVNYDPEIYTGFAFGLGVERVAMLKYGIPDIRSFYENDIRFLNQF